MYRSASIGALFCFLFLLIREFSRHFEQHFTRHWRRGNLHRDKRYTFHAAYDRCRIHLLLYALCAAQSTRHSRPLGRHRHGHEANPKSLAA
jgi:hypothetical protein